MGILIGVYIQSLKGVWYLHRWLRTLTAHAPTAAEPSLTTSSVLALRALTPARETLADLSPGWTAAIISTRSDSPV